MLITYNITESDEGKKTIWSKIIGNIIETLVNVIFVPLYPLLFFGDLVLKILGRKGFFRKEWPEEIPEDSSLRTTTYHSILDISSDSFSRRN